MQLKFKSVASLSMAAALLGTVTALSVADQDGITKPGVAPDAPERKVAKVGEKAPDFTLTDTTGKEHSLSDYAGKTVVLEWFNPECPFVVYLYREGSFKTQGNDLNAKDDFVWLAINSNPPGTQGGGLEKNQHYVKEWNIQYPLLMDENSNVGRLYDARVTPHMYIINPDGILVYSGAIDNAPRGNVQGGGEHVNYVKNALEQLASGETISPAQTRPYGCNVKYQKAAAPGSERPRRDRPNRPERPDRPDRPDRPERPR